MLSTIIIHLTTIIHEDYHISIQFVLGKDLVRDLACIPLNTPVCSFLAGLLWFAAFLYSKPFAAWKCPLSLNVR